MHTLVQEYQKKYTKDKFPQLRPGMTVKVTHKFLEGTKERSQVFQGVIIKMHAKTSLNATFTVRKVVDGIGVEKIYPIHSPRIEIEVLRASKVRRSKLYYLRDRAGKSARLREKDMEFKDILVEKPAYNEDLVVEAPVEEEVVATTEAPAAEAATTENA
ncbi:50S ribosomal protein L19 [Candidatus Gracilibacteria bacterium CG17_big_fil_post_rev_8_21_14_2_50_48_13]|nr:MAG: 50S ribosomal protein L19 [Candidatus Gracilibacteria bacterium CG17_big_fil_post_rev_8_21_14_2_50_48_13]